MHIDNNHNSSVYRPVLLDSNNESNQQFEAIPSLDEEQLIDLHTVDNTEVENSSTKKFLFNQLDKSFNISALMYFISSGLALSQNKALESVGDKLQRAGYLVEVASWVGRGTLDPGKKVNAGLVLPIGASAISAFFKSDSFIGRFSRYITHFGNIGVTRLHAEHVLDSEDEDHRPIRDLLNKAELNPKEETGSNIFKDLFNDTKFTFKLTEQALVEKPKLLLETFKSLVGKGKYNVPHIHAVSNSASILFSGLTAASKLIKNNRLSDILLNTLNLSPSVFALAGAVNTQNMKNDDLKAFGKFELISNIGGILSNIVAYKHEKFSVMVLQPIFCAIKNIAMAYEAKKLKS